MNLPILYIYTRFLRTTITTALAFCLLTAPQTVAAQSECYDNLVTSEQIVNQIQLSPTIPVRRGSGANQIIHEARVLVPYEKGMHVYVAGSADGHGNLVTDDVVEINVMDTGAAWTHDFRTGPNRAIQSIPPQDVTYLFKGESGVNIVSFQVVYQARNVLPPEYRSSEYWLVLWRECVEEEDVVIATATPRMPTSTATMPPATATPVIATATIVPEATATHLATPTLAPTATEIPVPLADEATWEWLISKWPSMAPTWAIPVAVLFLLALLGLMARSPTASQFGPDERCDIFESGTGEYMDTYYLAQMNKDDISIGKNGDIWLPALPGSTPVARIYSKGKGDQKATVMDLLSESNPNQVGHSLELYDGFQISFDPAYVVTYFNGESADANERDIEEKNYEYEF